LTGTCHQQLIPIHSSGLQLPGFLIGQFAFEQAIEHIRVDCGRRSVHPGQLGCCCL